MRTCRKATTRMVTSRMAKMSRNRTGPPRLATRPRRRARARRLALDEGPALSSRRAGMMSVGDASARLDTQVSLARRRITRCTYLATLHLEGLLTPAQPIHHPRPVVCLPRCDPRRQYRFVVLGRRDEPSVDVEPRYRQPQAGLERVVRVMHHSSRLASNAQSG
jgi:hypothetical protein